MPKTIIQVQVVMATKRLDRSQIKSFRFYQSKILVQIFQFIYKYGTKFSAIDLKFWTVTWRVRFR